MFQIVQIFVEVIQNIMQSSQKFKKIQWNSCEDYKITWHIDSLFINIPTNLNRERTTCFEEFDFFQALYITFHQSGNWYNNNNNNNKVKLEKQYGIIINNNNYSNRRQKSRDSDYTMETSA